MSFKSKIAASIILGLSSRVLATHGGHSGPSERFCPASCIQTVTVVSTASCAEPSLQTSTTAYLETYTNAGPYANASATESSVIQYTAIADQASSDATSTTLSVVSSSGTPLIPTARPKRCHHDNCLRQFFRSPQVSDFCATYTTEVNTATADLPNYVSQCHANPTRISSACSCIATTIKSVISTSTYPQTTKTAGGILVSASPSSNAEGCTLSSVVFETQTTTTTVSLTVSAEADSSSTDVSRTGTRVGIFTSSAANFSFTSIPYLSPSSASL